MPEPNDIARALAEHMSSPHSGFSIGSLGAIAEFHRAVDEPLAISLPERLTVATSRGAIRVTLDDDVMPVAYETLSRRQRNWQHGVVFCLPAAVAARHRRSVLTEIGPDRQAIREEDRGEVLFDIGASARNVDFLVRTGDASLVGLLRRQTGRSVFDAGNPAMSAILEASPHRIAASRLGRIEVFQEIGRTRTPEGPHTHVLPRLMRGGRTHSANIPVPAGWLPYLSLYPPNPLHRADGSPMPFRRSEHDAFQRLLAAWGPACYVREKQRTMRALMEGMAPDSYEPGDSRLGRTALRIALRQIRSQYPEMESALDAWSRRFEERDPEAASQSAGGEERTGSEGEPGC